jgi:hypothetical protein
MSETEIKRILKKYLQGENLVFASIDISKAIEDSFTFSKIQAKKTCIRCKSYSNWQAIGSGYCCRLDAVKNEDETCKQFEPLTKKDLYTCRVCVYRTSGPVKSYCSKHHVIKHENSKCKDFEHPF